MKSCLPALRQLLLEDATVAGLVEKRIYQFWAQQGGAYPDIVIQDITATPNTDLGGSTMPWTRRLSIHCRSTNLREVDPLAEAVMAVLENFRGTVRDFHIQQCTPVSDVPFKEDTSNVVSRIVDFRVTYSQ